MFRELRLPCSTDGPEQHAKLKQFNGEASLTRLVFAIFLLVLLGLGACGQTGELYWPEEEPIEVDEEESETNNN